MTVVSAGAASDSRLGRSGEPDIPAPVDIADTNGIICLGVGWFHNIIVYENGSAVGWGKNDDKQLGISRVEAAVPEPIEIFKDMKLTWVHCGDKITVALTRLRDWLVLRPEACEAAYFYVVRLLHVRCWHGVRAGLEWRHFCLPESEREWEFASLAGACLRCCSWKCFFSCGYD